MVLLQSQDMPRDIHSLRLWHCRAQQAAAEKQWHIAMQMYHRCLESAEARHDPQAVRFFARQLADCYRHMDLRAKASHFHALACARSSPPGV